MTPNEIYSLVPQTVSNRVMDLFGEEYGSCNKSPFKDVEPIFAYMALNDDTSERIQIRVYEYQPGMRRTWKLASAWLDGLPVMIMCYAGREGDDHNKIHITDREQYDELARHVRSLIAKKERPELPDNAETIGPDEDKEELTNFYGHKLGGYVMGGRLYD